MSAVLSRSLVSYPGLANSRWYGPHLFSHLVSSKSTGGEVALIRFHGQAGGEPPVHKHSRDDEFFYILEGSFVFEAGGKQMKVEEGTFVWLPRDVEHVFKAQTATGKGLAGFLPGNLEDWFLEFSRPVERLGLPDAVDAPDVEGMLTRGGDFGLEFCLSSMGATKPNPNAKNQPFARSRDEAGEVVFPGMTHRFLAGSDETGGVLTVFEVILEPGVSIPLHTKSHTEISHVLEGRARFQLGDRLVEVAAGTVIANPLDTPFGYRNIGDSPLRVLHIELGGRFDVFSREVAPMFGTPEPNVGEIAETLDRYGMRLLAPEIADR